MIPLLAHLLHSWESVKITKGEEQMLTDRQ